MKSPWWSATLLTGLTMWICPAFSYAQPTQRPPRSFSFMPAPAERTRWFLASDLSALYLLTSERRSAILGGDLGKFLLASHLGIMKNVSRRYAVGITGNLEIEWSFWRIGLSPRLTYWITRSAHASFEPVLIVTGGDRACYPGVGVHVSVNPSNWVGLDFRAESLKYVLKHYGTVVTVIAEHRDVSVYSGVRIGGIPGLILPSVVGAGFLLYAVLAGFDI